MSHGVAIALLALPALGAGAMALWHLRQTLARPVLLFEDLVLSAAWIYIGGALVWLEAYLSGSTLLGFSAPWTWLTAAHFGAAGFGALTITAYLRRAAPEPRTRRVLLALLVLHPLAFASTAAGIAGAPYFDEVGAAAYLLLFVVQALAFARGPIRGRGSWPGVLLGVALCVPVVTLVPALSWAWGRPMWNLDEMIRYHGLVNAIGHVGLGLLAIAWLRPPRRLPPMLAPVSRLTSKGPVDQALIDRYRAEGTPPGLTPRFAAYQRPGFDPAAVHPDIAAFYEQTARFELRVVGRWRWPFRFGGWIWTRLVAPRLGQLALPDLDAESGERELCSEIIALDDALDGRAQVRGWVRRWRDSGKTLYFAAYSEHVRDGVRYMNIAFPLPGANLTSILHLDPIGEGGEGGVRFTSRHEKNFDGDQGVYLVARGRPLRLPLDETISVYAASAAPPDLAPADDACLVARHEMWCFGLCYLSLRYQICRRG